MKIRIKSFAKRVLEIIRKPIMSILPGQLAFSFVLSIIPILALLGLIGTMFSISASSLATVVQDTFPDSASKLLLPLINGKGLDTGLILFVITSFLLASNGSFSIIITADLLYGIEPKGFVTQIKARIKSILITVMLLLLLCFLILVPGFGDNIVTIIGNMGTEGFKQILFTIYDILKYPISFILIYFCIKLIYTIAPSKYIKSKTVTVGALFTTTFWIILTRIYSYYVSHFAVYDIFYGSLSNLIILLLWMYLLAFVFVIGLSINSQSKIIEEKETT
jgi:membrane protein